MHFPGNFKSLVHDAIGGAAERAYEVIAPFDQGIRHNGSGDQLAGESSFGLAILCSCAIFLEPRGMIEVKQ